MKLIAHTLLITLLLSSISAFASVNGPFLSLKTRFDGYYTKTKEIYFHNYPTEILCEADNGSWDAETESCLFEATDEVQVSKVGPNQYLVDVNTIGTNAHTCTFTANAYAMSPKALRAIAPSEPNEQQNQQWPPQRKCEVYLEFNGDKVDVEDNGKCRSFCGARAQLFIEGAQRN